MYKITCLRSPRQDVITLENNQGLWTRATKLESQSSDIHSEDLASMYSKDLARMQSYTRKKICTLNNIQDPKQLKVCEE